MIPTDSMTPAIEPGDYIMVNKLYKGARFYKQLKFESGKTPETFRVPGYSSIRRNDIVVFNLPTPLFSDQMEMDPIPFLCETLYRLTRRYTLHIQRDIHGKRTNRIRKLARTVSSLPLPGRVPSWNIPYIPLRYDLRVDHALFWSPVYSGYRANHSFRYRQSLSFSQTHLL